MDTRPGRAVERRIVRFEGSNRRMVDDAIVTEEPLEMRIVAGNRTETLAITMRTPGNDFELAAGFFFGEGLIGGVDDVDGITYCTDPAIDAEQRYNIVNVALRSHTMPGIERLERHFTTTSACGVCGRAHLEALQERGIAPLTDATRVTIETIYALSEKMREAQLTFAKTGGLHAAALFTTAGELLATREDVGRHNAVDKLVGWALTNGTLPLHERILFVSGRAGYEILQKAVVARIPVVCSVSAPSSLAIDLAHEFGVTLVGFVRGTTANVYSSGERIVASA